MEEKENPDERRERTKPDWRNDPSAGHRDRLRKELATYGISEKNEYRAVELLLFYAIPYKDTRPLARRLVNEHGNLFGILNAPKEQLMKTEGVTENIATFFGAMANIADRYLYESFSQKPIADASDVMDIVKRYITPGMESCFVVSVGVEDELIKVLKVSEGVKSVLEVPVRDIVRTILLAPAYRVIVVHNHPSGVGAPSDADRAYTFSLGEMLKTFEVELIDHVIIHGEVAYSMRTKKSYCHTAGWQKREEEKL